MNKKYNFLKKDNDGKVTFEGYYLEVLVSKEHKENDMFFTSGASFGILGLFTFRVKESENSDLRTFTLTLPATIITSPSSSENVSMVLDTVTGDPESVTVLKYEKGDTFIENSNITKNSADGSKFVSLIHGGKIPNAVAYGEIYGLYMNALNIHGIGVHAPSSIIEIIISSICRIKGKIDTPFRVKAGTEGSKVDEHAYEMFNMKRIPMLTSTFAAVSFEDMNNALNASVVRNQEGQKQSTSPVEKTIKY